MRELCKVMVRHVNEPIGARRDRMIMNGRQHESPDRFPYMMCSFFCPIAGAVEYSLRVATEQHVESDDTISDWGSHCKRDGVNN